MPDDTFKLFPGDKEASPGDAVVQFLIDEQKKGNKRARAVGDLIGEQIEQVFPGFNKSLEGITSSAEQRRQQLNKAFGLNLGKPITSETIESSALSFGVGSIKGITGIPGLGVRFGIPRSKLQEEITRPRQFSIRGVQETKKAQKAVEGTGQENFPFESAKEGQFIPFPGEPRNIGGVRPPIATLEAKAVAAQTQKRIQTQVKSVQKDLDALLISEAVPGMPPNIMQELAIKGFKGAAVANDNGSILISFRSKGAELGFNDEFVITQTEDGTPVLGVNFASPTIKPGIKEVFKKEFSGEFLGDSTEMDASFYQIRDFTDGMRLINRMTDLIE